MGIVRHFAGRGQVAPMTLLSIPDEALSTPYAPVVMERMMCEKSLYEFIRHGWHVLEPSNPFQDAMHLRALCAHLEAVTDGRIRKLIANVCPGFAKSLCCCVFWPAWEWIFKPDRKSVV